MKWRIEHRYVDHWDDAGWTTNQGPERFDSAKEAQEALDDFIEEARIAAAEGDLFEPIDPGDYRVRAVMR